MDRYDFDNLKELIEKNDYCVTLYFYENRKEVRIGDLFEAFKSLMQEKEDRYEHS